ncbi:zf-HC2 domain-containing protein [Spongiactinospora sp. TRM90649]|uniref:anti-sigma factor family protein n=1 Tax=Spongiactinospora sp. TRM90649 TaxID=3031114 RepID=UPI0023F932BB|nr:zf-HC2 domain-containing protein [Spongiactinospora sp. TRM90649]MDF5757873.1 zf-HC2 domain-containing protein [Spongiactinospora sp. TRM90649]
MTSRIEHTDVGAYALGLLDDDDRRAFAEHLTGCSPCTAELSEMTGLAGMLRGVDPVEDPKEPPGHETAEDRAEDTAPVPPGEVPDSSGVIDLMRRKRAADRRARRGTFVIGVAAAVALVAGGMAAGNALGGRAAEPVAAGHSHGPAEEFYLRGKPIPGAGAPGVSGGLVVEAKPWGTHAALQLKGVKGPLECELVAVAKTGERRVVTGWAVPSAGYGVPGHPDPLYVHGGAALPPEGLDRFEVVTTSGKTLLTVRV